MANSSQLQGGSALFSVLNMMWPPNIGNSTKIPEQSVNSFGLKSYPADFHASPVTKSNTGVEYPVFKITDLREVYRRCKSLPWCQVSGTSSVNYGICKEPAICGAGRTAICAIGHPRRLFSHPRELTDSTSALHGNIYVRNHRWAGPRRKRYPDNLIATSWHNNIYAPLTAFEGGFDVFVIKQRHPRQPPATNGGYDALEPETVDWSGEPNKMIVFEVGEEPSLPINDHLLCNELIRNHSRATNISYAYKMRVRTDYAPVAPIPPLHTLDFGTDKAPKVLVSSAAVQNSNSEDVAIGRPKTMDGPRITLQAHEGLEGYLFRRRSASLTPPEHGARAAENSAVHNTSRRRCESKPWCNVPVEDTPRGQIGRTAICVTGQPRSLFVHPQDLDYPASILPGEMYMKNHRWAGPRRKRYPNNLIATSWHNNIYAPLAMYGGFDVFVVKQGPVREAQGVVIPPRQAPATNGGYDALEPETVDWSGEPNKMIVFEKGEEFSLPINDTADNWRSYYMAVKFRNTASRFYLRAVYSQSALWMAYDQLLCNELIRNHSRETNTTYAYKIRLRTDYAPVAPFPPLHTVDFGTDKAPKVRISTATVYNGGNEDGFAVGRTKQMDVYLDRYPRHHAWNARYIWTTEAFLWEHLRNVSNATLNSDKGFGLLVMRVKNHTRGQPANSMPTPISASGSTTCKRARLTDWETQGLPGERDRPHPQQ